jgi:hypothetical protein
MERFDNPLENIKIASPCSADWNAMTGNERRRFCGECKLNVYNLSGMTRYDAENLLRVSEGRLCVRYFRRTDGTILTADCPVGWAKVKQLLSVCAAAAFSLLLAVLSGLMAVAFLRKHGEFVRRIPVPFATPTPQPLMGAIAVPTPTPKATPQKKVERPVVPAGKFAE